MKLFKMALVALALCAQTAMADEKIESVKFFEPTQQDYNCCSKDIKAQQHRYQVAKDQKHWQDAADNALFYWTRAWVHFNWAVATAYSKTGWKDEAALKDALSFLSLAITDATNADSKEGVRILKLCARNSETITKRIEELHKKAESN